MDRGTAYQLLRPSVDRPCQMRYRRHMTVHRDDRSAIPLTLVVEGWRRGTHSYALVNQHQLLALSKAPGLSIRHHDLVPPDDTPGAPSLFSDSADAWLRSLPAAESSSVYDVAYRIAAPFDLEPSPRARQTCIFLTSEHRYVPTSLMARDEPFARAASRTRTHIVTPSRWSRDGLVLAGADPNRVTIIPHGVDCTIFRPSSIEERQVWRRTNSVRTDSLTFLHVGAMTGNKGVQDLVRAFAIIAQLLPNAHLILKGNDALYDSRRRLERLLDTFLDDASRQRVLSRLTYVGGRLTNQEMQALYGSADVYVSPYSAEGFNMPVLEAVACGLPVVVTKGGPTDDFVPAGSGLFVASRLVAASEGLGEHLDPDFPSLVDAMGRAALDPTIRSQAATIGPTYAAATHSWDAVAAAMVNLFRKLV
jgi:glycosyltransferase involved in cell wall biosynthesis